MSAPVPALGCLTTGVAATAASDLVSQPVGRP